MGDPFFQIRDRLRQHRVRVFSSNYVLYGDMSRRVLATLQEFSPHVEPYSIDESFLDLTGFNHLDLTEYARAIRATVRQYTGIPTCIGIGPTKTLAKLANRIAKDVKDLGGVCDLTDPSARERILPTVPVAEVWGIGKASVAKLGALGIETVAQYRDADPRVIRQKMGVVGARTLHELRGLSCLALEEIEPQRKGMAVTRSFGHAVTEKAQMLEAIAAYATRAGEKLRQRGLAAVTMSVFAHTNRHNGDPSYTGQATCEPIEPTNDTLELVGLAVQGVNRLWRNGFRFAKCGVILPDLVAADVRQRNFLAPGDTEKRARLMAAVDEINLHNGRGTIFPARCGIARTWKLRSGMKSPSYTTRISDIPKIKH